MDFWINSTKVMSILAAGFFGTLGLLTKYRDKDDKITRHGKIALGGIIFTAVLSLALQLLQTSKESVKQRDDAIRSASEARKAEESARATSTRLQDILSTATETSNKQEKNLAEAKRLTGKMDDSLKTQGEVLQGNKRILGGVVEGAHRDTQNTIGILRTIWDESNRIDANQVTAKITYTFLKDTEKPPPLLMAAQGSLSILASSNPPQPLTFPLNQWRSRHLLVASLKLQTRAQRVVQRKYVSVDNTVYEQDSYFSDFSGSVRNFSDMTTWNGALVEVLLTDRDPPLLKELETSVKWNSDPNEGWQAFRTYHVVPDDLQQVDGYSITPLPIEAHLTVYLRGRVLVTSKTVLVSVKERDKDVGGFIVAKFRIEKLADNTFPEFKPTL